MNGRFDAGRNEWRFRVNEWPFFEARLMNGRFGGVAMNGQNADGA
jgi:hypothetical protein